MSSKSKGRRIDTKSGVRHAPYKRWHGFAKKSLRRLRKSQKWHEISDEIATVLFGRLPTRKVAGVMGGLHRPLTCCDSDCALANGCRVGGYRCDVCGRWYCVDEVEKFPYRTLCVDCAEAEETRNNEQEEQEQEEQE